MGNTWTPAAKEPPQLKHILFLTRKGSVYKGFLNLRGTWIIDNADGLITQYIRDTNDVIGWMDLPDKGAEWKRAGEEPPAEASRVLAMDRHGDVYIVNAYKNVWVIRNGRRDHSTYSIWPDEGSLWMPLPDAV